MSFSETVRNQALVACMRSCCICHKFAGTKIELHHIVFKGERGGDTFDNAIPLCLNCHADMKSYDFKHPKGSKYSPKELKAHRDSWYKRVSEAPAVRTSYNDGYRDLDIAVFEEIKSILPWNGSIQMARQHTFSKPFLYSSLNQLREYTERSEDPAFEFIDADLEVRRTDLLCAIDKFLRLIGEYIFSDDNNDAYSQIPINWKRSDREMYYQAVKNLQKAGDNVGSAYDALIRMSRRRLVA